MAKSSTIIVTVLALAAFGGTVALFKDRDIDLPLLSRDRPQTGAPSGSLTPASPATGTPLLFSGVADLVERATPAVVNIQVKAEAEQASLPPIFQDPRFRRFFGIPDEAPQQPRERASVGSGVIVDAQQGHVLTNFHVVDKATDIAVTLKDRRTFTATVVGKDQATDLALLKIEARDLTALPLGDMADTRVGDYVLAIGNPFGLGQTVTGGIVSALGRAGFIEQGYEDFIQTDAAINPGNSGGALVNLKGELIGIPTVIIGSGGVAGNIGIGFAVPTTIARNVMDQLIQFGEVSRGRIGVAIRDVTPELAQNMGLNVNSGAVVTSVERGAPADKAGIRAGDVAIALNGVDIESSSSLRNRVGLIKPGEKVKLTIIRDGERRDVDITIEKASPAQQTAAAPEPEEPSRLLGATFENTASGVRIRNVGEDTPAAAAGLQTGDLITAVNRTRVRTGADVEAALKSAKGQSVLYIQRDGRDQVVVLP